MPSSAFVPSNSNARKKPLAGAICAVLLSGALIPGFAAIASMPGSGAKAADAVTASTSERVRYTIVLQGEPLATYKGGVPGYAAAPRVQAGRRAGRLDVAAPGARAYVDYLASRQTTLVNELAAAFGRPLAPVAQMQHALNAVIVEMDEAEADLARRRGDVALVEREHTLELLTDRGPSFIGAPSIWDGSASDGVLTQGEGVVAGVLDTGINWQSPAFAAVGPIDGYVHVNPNGAGTYLGLCGPLPPNADLGHCNDKLIGMYDFTSTATDRSGNDLAGHGSHTASTVAGNHWLAPFGGGTFTISGVAPHANVIAYRVCTSGCSSTASSQATNQAVIDGVDVINFSISGGGNPYADAVELAFLDAFKAGISVNASAGNSGPGAATSDHGGPWVTTVGASTGPRSFNSTLHLTADGASLDVPGVTLTNGISTPTPVVLASTLPGEDAACQSTLAAGTATGKIVVCARGGNGRIDKGRRVLAGGAVGMILYNQSAAVTDLESDNHYLPAIQTQFNADSIRLFVSSHTNVKATWSQGIASPAQADVMASFSSRGPLGDFLKPDVTAPGVQVLAGTTPQPDQTTADNGPTGNLFMAIAGTSMSSPHSAGVSALIKAAHPDWTPAMIKSALMTSAAQGVVKENGTTPADPFDAGAGSIRANLAVNPTLVFDETYDDFVASATTPLSRIDLNIASVDAPTMTGLITTKRTAINVSGKDQDLDISTEAPAGVTILVSDKKPKDPGPDGKPAPLPKDDNKIHLKKDGTTDIWITISAPEVANGQYFGRITLDPKKNGYNPVTIPVAFNKRQGIVTLTHVCSPTTFPKTDAAHCLATVANFGSLPADVDLTVTNLDKGKGLDFTNITAPATAIKKDDGVAWSGVLTPAIPPQVSAVTLATGSGPAGGYLPLSLFGIAPIAGVGDDTITNFNVPTFFYGGESYSRVGVVSNGYLVIGGGTGADVNFAPQTFPNATRPNNVIAPFWTDLNPPAGGAIRIGTLTDGATTWLVIDWAAVKNFSNATTHTGEIWLRLASGAAGTGPASEQITISYGLANAAAGDPGSGINWGAENRDGTSGKNIPSPGPANNSEYVVVLTPPTAGGSAAIGYDASSKKAGTYKSVASMTSDQTPGTTQVVQTLTVTP